MKKVISLLLLITHINASIAQQWKVLEKNSILTLEQEALKKRFPVIKKTIEKLIKQSLEDKQVPTIGIVCSGGGCRAAVAALGFLNGLEENSVQPACAYIATLSGSTWMLGSLLASGKSFDTFTRFFQQRLERGVNPRNFEMKDILIALWNKWWKNNQHISITDVYGCILAHLFLKDQKQVLSHASKHVINGEIPIPYLTAGIDNQNQREYIELSPLTCGSINFLQRWTETQAAGKHFTAGISNDNAQEQKLDFWMGCCGSAYAFGLSDAIQYILWWISSWWPTKQNNSASITTNNVEKFQKYCKGLLDQYKDEHKNLALVKTNVLELSDSSLYQLANGYIAGRINNFMKKIPNAPLTGDDYITLVDAAISLPNLPLSPLLHRNDGKGLDMYLVCDASGGKKSDGIKLLEKYAQERKLTLPTFDYEKIDNDEICLFYEENNPEVPVIFYVPNNVWFGTLKFQYSKEEFNTLHDTMKARVRKSLEILIKGIKIAIEHKNKRFTRGCFIL